MCLQGSATGMLDREAAAAQRAPESGLLGRQLIQIHLCLLCGSKFSIAVGALSLAWPSLHRGSRVTATPEPGLDTFPL